MSQPSAKQVSCVPITKGSRMKMYVDESKSLDSIDRKWSLTIYDGELGSGPCIIPLHWHKFHDEHMEMLEGEAAFHVDGKKFILKQGESIIVRRGIVHGFSGILGKRFVLKESTNPTGDFKEHFFLDVFNTQGPPSLLHRQRASWDGDTYFPVVTSSSSFWGGHFIDELWLFILGGFAKVVHPSRPSLDLLRQKWN